MRIVSLVPSITETLYALGLEEQIVGITRFCRLPSDRVRLKTRVGGTKNPKLDEILALKPDVAIMNVDENRKEDADFLKSHGLELFVTFPNSIAETLQMIEQIGERFSVQTNAEKLCNEIRALLVFTPPATRRTLTLVWRHPYITINDRTYVHDIGCFFGFESALPKTEERYPRLNDGEIRIMKPDVVLFPDDPYPFRDKHVAEFRQLFPDLSAKLAWFDGTYFTWFGSGTLRALREFPKIARQHRLWE